MSSVSMHDAVNFSSTNEILRWIEGFHDAQITFTTRCCYWFAYLLHKRYGAEIYYAPILGHFVGKIDDTYYDVTGEFVPAENENMLSWDYIQQTDPLWAKRLVKYCVDLYDE